MRYVDGCELKEPFSDARLERNVFSSDRFLVRKIVLPVRFAQVKEEAAKPNSRRKTKPKRRRGTRSKARRQHDPPEYKR